MATGSKSSRRTPAEGDAGRQQLERLDAAREAGDVRETMRAHTDFHFTLYEASQEPWLVSLIRPAWDRSERFRPALLASAGDPQDRHRALDEQLLDACIAHRPDEAAKAFYDHLELASVFGMAVAILRQRQAGRGDSALAGVANQRQDRMIKGRRGNLYAAFARSVCVFCRWRRLVPIVTLVIASSS